LIYSYRSKDQAASQDEEFAKTSMIRLIFIQRDGIQRTVHSPLTGSIMQAARDAEIPGILGDCGGACACATCHVVVDPSWARHLPPASEAENAVLEFAIGLEPTSRLCCQIQVDKSLDGMVMTLPDDG
jgi:2Fe-2S ferredoxin